jgi:hypothetical protein
MKKIIDKRLVPSALAVALALGTTAFTGAIHAAVDVDKDGKVKLFGDVRFRVEGDKQDKADGTSRDRNRARLRARIGASFKANDQWSGKIRFATNSTSLNSPYMTLGTGQTDKNGDFGLDQAYITYTPMDSLSFIGGKAAMILWQQNEMFWDDDINPEGLAVKYNIGGLTLNGAYYILEDGNWGGDISTTAYQAVYGGKVGSMKYTAALGGASLTQPEPSGVNGYQSTQHTIGSLQLKPGAWLFGIDYVKSNASVKDTAYVGQVRYKFGDNWGLRAYYYRVEAFSVLGDGTYSQDNFPNPGLTGVSNFTGTRLQVDYKIASNTNLDLRYYSMKSIEDPATLPATPSDALMSADKHDRLQLNLTVKF